MTCLPRPCRFVARRITLTRQFGIGETLMSNLAHSKTETLSIVLVFAIVKTKHLLINVTREMKRLNCNIRSFKSTLQETPEVFESVRVHSAFYVLFRVIYNFVDVLLSERIIDNRIVAVHSAAIFHAAKN